MKLTNKQLRQIIKEELEAVLGEESLNEVDASNVRFVFFPKQGGSQSEIDPSRHMLACGKKQMRGDQEVVPYAAYDVKEALQKAGEGSRAADSIKQSVLKFLGTGKAQSGFSKFVGDNVSNVLKGESYVLTREDFEQMGAAPGVADYAFS